MSGCLPPWSKTNPLTSWVSLANRWTICMIYTMWRSIGLSAILMILTASTTISTSWFARSGCNLVQRAVLATLISKGFSTVSLAILKLSKNFRAYFLASSYPSVMMRGWTCSWMRRCACFMSSPIKRTLEVVPSPTMSSWAVAERAIMPAVGCWICI